MRVLPLGSQRCAHDSNVVISTVGTLRAVRVESSWRPSSRQASTTVDLTGEPQWMRRMIDRYQDRAVETGARLVHACGFDLRCRPTSAFGTLQQEAIEATSASRALSISDGGQGQCQRAARAGARWPR